MFVVGIHAWISQPSYLMRRTCTLSSTSAHLAARMAYTAEFEFGDIEDRTVLDLGCGTGMLGIAAGMLGASAVVGLDMSEVGLAAALENAKKMDVELDLVRCDVARNPCVPGVVTIILFFICTCTYIRVSKEAVTQVHHCCIYIFAD